MNTVLWCFVQNTLTVALVIPAVAVAARLCRNRPAGVHVLWAVVLLKFVTPPVFIWPLPAQHLSPSFSSILPPVSGARLSTPLKRLAFMSDDTPIGKAAGGAPDDRLGRSNSAPVQALGQVPSLANGQALSRLAFPLFFAVWLIGIAVCTSRQVHRIALHASIVRRARKPPEQLTREIEAMAMQVGLRPPKALVTRGITSPVIWFLCRLRLIWPETLTGCDDVIRSRGVIAHELAHVRRGDHLLAWVDLLAGLLWWWNPIFWFVRRRVRESAELACDAIALSVCPGSRRTYAELLLELSSISGSPSPAPVLGIKAGTASSFERRLSMILSDRVSGKMPAWGLMAAAALAIVTLPGLSLAQKSAETIVASSVETAESAKQNPTSTAARLEQIESELKRVFRLLEEAKRSAPDQSEKATAPARRDAPARPKDATARWTSLMVLDKHSTVISFSGFELQIPFDHGRTRGVAECPQPKKPGSLEK